MTTRRLSRDEIGQRGFNIYQEQLQEQLEAEFHGQFVAIDVETKEYEVASEAAIATETLWRRRPNAQVFVERIGYPAAFHAYSDGIKFDR